MITAATDIHAVRAVDGHIQQEERRIPPFDPTASVLASLSLGGTYRPTWALPVLSSLSRPSDLFMSAVPYILTLSFRNEGLVVYCSHEPTLELLNEYLKKWAKTNAHDKASTSDLPTSLSSSNVPLYSHSDFSNTAQCIVSLPTTIALESFVGLKYTPSPLTLASINGIHTPGELPIPSIATTEPSGPDETLSVPSDSDDSPSDPSFPNSSDNIPSNGIPQADVYASNDSLLPALTYRQYHGRRSLDASDDSSDGGDSEATSGESGPAPKATAKKKPKPVIMRPAYKRYLIATLPPSLSI
ncbi:hypothetical protein EDD18DRAFT_1396770 [Armillaria luteobubalina]|uniref:Uncharacterized protein n=1 Tax=Armillaria luteobubalina TaxID=153913 RepID=A0AA39TYX1_9AGAR|nr:hypothetical protein EDD18DRAFT_1396770 [Armillaria luteobubalina]